MKDRKRKISSKEISELRRKCQAAKNIILSLNKATVKLSLEPEEKPDFDLLKKATVLRKAS